ALGKRGESGSVANNAAEDGGGGFLINVFGKPPDMVSATFMCYVDRSWTKFLKCMEKVAADVSTACPHNSPAAGLISDNDCVLQYSNWGGFSVETERGIY
ncbi:hypothetical protein BAE44_0002146, partial [Dichanthelium oligosanthes]